jgi:zinc protease
MTSGIPSVIRGICRWTIPGILSALLVFPAAAMTAERVVSSSGIEAWLVREPSAPLIAMNFAFRGGSSQDPADKAGVANMVAHLLTEGAGDFDSRSFHERLQAAAIELYFSADRDRLGGWLRTLVENQTEAFDLLKLALTAPRFDAADLERIGAETRTLLRNESKDPNAIAFERFWQAAFPGHPYGRPVRGTFETISSISTDDLRAYVRNVLARDTLKIAIVGNIDVAKAALLIDQAFGNLPAKPDLSPVPIVDPQGSGQRIVVDLDVPQSVAVIGGAAVARRDADFLAAQVVNQVLGGDMPSSRLFGEVREKRGLVYSVRSTLVPMAYSALFTICTATRPDRMDQTLEAIGTEIRRLAHAGPTEDELSEARAVLKGSYAIAFDSSRDLAEQLVAAQFDDLGTDFVDRYGHLLDGIRLEDVKRVVHRLLDSPLLITVAR